MEFDSYLETVRIRLAAARFELGDDEGQVALYAHRRQVKLTRFGIVETMISLSSPRQSASADELRAFANDGVRSALRRKIRIPRGLGSSVVVYPTFVVETASPELRQLVARYAPKHWSVLEFPVVVELTSETLVCLETTPFWGAAYYRKTREEARVLLSP